MNADAFFSDFLFSEIYPATRDFIIDILSEDMLTDFRYEGNQYEIVKQRSSSTLTVTDIVSKEWCCSDSGITYEIEKDDLIKLIKSKYYKGEHYHD